MIILLLGGAILAACHDVDVVPPPTDLSADMTRDLATDAKKPDAKKPDAKTPDAKTPDAALPDQSVKPPPKKLAGLCSKDKWCWVNPLPQGNALNAMWGTSATDVYAVGDNGTILRRQ